MKYNNEQSGFSLLELIIAMGVMTILITISIATIKPGRIFATANNTQRQNNLLSISNAIYQKTIDDGGNFNCSVSLPNTETLISSSGINLAECLVPNYLDTMPHDPKGGNYKYVDKNNYSSGYTIYRDAVSGRNILKAPETELGLPMITINQ